MNVASLAERRTRLGGSTIGAACGADPWCSPIRLWLEMTGRYEREATEAMHVGTLLQPVIFALLVERGYEDAQETSLVLRDPDTPWLVGHPDGLTDDGSIVEAKAMGRGTDELPPHHEAQVQTYMHLADVDGAIVAQLAGLHLTVWEVERNPRVIDALLAGGEAFMEYVRSDTQPPPSEHRDDRDALLLAYPHGEPGKVVRETREVRDARRELVGLLEAEKARKARIEHLRAVVTDHMGEAVQMVDAHDAVVATWANVSSRRLDTALIRKQRPDLYDLYATETTTRRLVV